MGLGVLESADKDVPGTSCVIQNASIKQEEAATLDSHLKRHGNIILVPQPSDDPNDPLNWSLRKRDGILAILCTVSVIASALSPLLAANTLTLSLHFGTGFGPIALLTGYHLLGVGLAGFVFIASARVWGKRHLYLLGAVLIIASSAWGGSATSYSSLLGARLVQGFGLAPFEALVNASVGDLYFVHERGVRMAASNMAVYGGAFFTPILVGKITDTLGWRWTFYFIAIFIAAFLPLLVFFVPETAFRRPAHFDIDIAGDGAELSSRRTNGTLSSSSDKALVDEPADVSKRTTSRTAHSMASKEYEAAHTPSNGATIANNGLTQVTPRKVSWAESLMPFNGRKTDENIFKLVLRPFPLFLHPGILWACVTQGALIGWTVLIGVVLAAIFLGPPLWFDEVVTGYMYTGPFIGAVLGFVLSGLLSDWSTKLMIRRNGGVYEPEFRIVLVIPQLVFGGVGLYGFGISSAYVQPGGWFLPDFFFALEVMGMVIGAVASALYIVDAHREIAVEAFTCLLIFKNILSFGLTWSAYTWLVNNGVLKTFLIISSIQIFLCLLSVPMYVFGKRNRALMKRYDLLKICHLW